MKLVSYDSGRALQLIVMEEIRPHGGIYMRHFVEALNERYGFAQSPDLRDADSDGSYVFNQGNIILDGQSIMIGQLGIYTDGIVIVCQDTESANKVLDDGLQWITEKFGLRPILTRKQRTFTSTLIIEFDFAIERALRKWDAVGRLLGSALQNSYGWSVKPDLTRLAFQVDKENLPAQANSLFLIERRADIPHSQNRFYSAAPLQTRLHLEFLRDLEALFAED